MIVEHVEVVISRMSSFFIVALELVKPSRFTEEDFIKSMLCGFSGDISSHVFFDNGVEDFEDIFLFLFGGNSVRSRRRRMTGIAHGMVMRCR
jgi:hypothetical protein